KEGFTWLGTSDGAVGGTLALPATAAKLGDQPETAISLDGKKFAAVLPLPPPGDSGKRLGLTNDRRLVVAWDVATGKATDGVIVKHGQMHGRFPHTAAWCGERHLLLGGAYLLDLDLSTPIWFYKIKYNTRTARTTPDGRVWYAAGDQVEGLAKHF